MKTILVIEDDYPIQDLIVEVLQCEGYSVITADDGQQGLEHLQAQRPDLVVSDVLLPYLTGIELVQAIRANPHHQQIPVVGISAAPYLDRATRRLFTSFLAKPFHVHVLVATIARCIGVAV